MANEHLSRLRRVVSRTSDAEPPRVVRLAPAGGATNRALVGYLREPAAWADDDPRLAGHTNRWESREICRALVELGFGVDVVEWSDRTFTPDEPYELVFAIEGQLTRMCAVGEPQHVLLHATGAHPRFQNPAELARLAELRERRGVVCVPRRLAPDVEGFESALRMATSCSVLGNDWTRSTFPADTQHKLVSLDVTASVLSHPKTPAEIADAGRGFLWFFGSGAVHKGLDRVLEVFAALPDLRLEIVGNIGGETDFLQAYERELALPNVRFHGYLDPRTRGFRRVARACSYVVAPSCSEGMSPATATALCVGLYPVLSRATGITLPDGCGRYLETCAVDEIADAVRSVAALPGSVRDEQTVAVQRDAATRYSRPRFAAAIRRYLAGAAR